MEELPSPHHMEALCSSEHCGDANWPGGLLEEDMDVNLFDFAMDLNAVSYTHLTLPTKA